MPNCGLHLQQPWLQQPTEAENFLNEFNGFDHTRAKSYLKVDRLRKKLSDEMFPFLCTSSAIFL